MKRRAESSFDLMLLELQKLDDEHVSPVSLPPSDVPTGGQTGAKNTEPAGRLAEHFPQPRMRDTAKQSQNTLQEASKNTGIKHQEASKNTGIKQQYEGKDHDTTMQDDEVPNREILNSNEVQKSREGLQRFRREQKLADSKEREMVHQERLRLKGVLGEQSAFPLFEAEADLNVSVQSNLVPSYI